jgi:outer membrane receptor protein involved in Fe transport
MLNQSLKIKLLVLGAIIFSINTISAQEEDNLGTEVVNIVKPYSPTISDAFKVKENPLMNDSTNTQKKEVNYSIFSVPVASTFTPAKGKATSIEKAKPLKLYDNYATFGMGNYTNVLAEFYSNFEISRTDNFGLFFKHNSSQGGIKDILLDDKFYDTQLEGNYLSRQKDLNYEMSASIKHQLFNWYGLNSLYNAAPPEIINSIDAKHSYFSGFAEGSLMLEDSYFEKGTASIRYLGDSFLSSEFNIKVKPEFGFDVIDFPLKIGVDIDYLSGTFKRNYSNTSAIKYGFLNTGIIPSYEYTNEYLSLSVGFAGYVSLNAEESKTNFYVYPKIEASYRLVDELLIVYGGIDGGLEQNSYYNFKEVNPFVSPTLFIQPTSELYNGFAGLKGKLTNAIAYNIRASYSKEDDKALFISNIYKGQDLTLEGYEYGNSFTVVYDDIETISFFGELIFEVSTNFNLGINGTYNSYHTKPEIEPWNLPSIQATLFITFNITEKFYGGASMFFVGERKDLFYNYMFPTFSPTIVTLDSYFDANAHIGYRFNKQLSIFVKGSNLFGDNYQKWTNYKVQGIQGMLGASYKFDW